MLDVEGTFQRYQFGLGLLLPRSGWIPWRSVSGNENTINGSPNETLHSTPIVLPENNIKEKKAPIIRIGSTRPMKL